MAKVTIYTRAFCPYCSRAVSHPCPEKAGARHVDVLVLARVVRETDVTI